MKWIIGIAIAVVVIYGFIQFVEWSHRHHLAEKRDYQHRLNEACANHRGARNITAIGQTGAYLVCIDGYVPPKVEK